MKSQGKESCRAESAQDAWFVYLVRCNDGSLYTGIAKNLEQRIAEHNSIAGGAKYTRSRQPVTLVYKEQHVCRAHAAQREWQIKQMSKADKEVLVLR